MNRTRPSTAAFELHHATAEPENAIPDDRTRAWAETEPDAAEQRTFGDGHAHGARAPDDLDHDTFLIGAEAVRAFIAREWRRELDYRLKKEVWTYSGNTVSVFFEYEWHDAESGKWMLTHGEECWQIGADGLLHRLKATGKDVPIAEINRWILPKPTLG